MMPSSDEEEEEEGDAFYEEVMEVEDSEVEDGSEDEGAGRVGAGRAEVPEEAVTAVTSNLVEKNSTQPVASKRLSKEESKRPLLSKKMFEKVPRRKKKRGLKEKEEYDRAQRWNNMRTARGTPVNRRRVRQSDILESDMEEAGTTDEESETETRRLQWVEGMSVQVPFKCDGETVWFPGVLLKRLKRQGEKKWMVHFLDGDKSAVCESKLKPVCT